MLPLLSLPSRSPIRSRVLRRSIVPCVGVNVADPRKYRNFTSAVRAVGELKAAGLCSPWTSIGWVQGAVDYLHSSGLPWWGSIAITTIALRLIITPLQLSTQAKMATVLPTLKQSQDRLIRIKEEMNTPSISPAAHMKLQQEQEEVAHKNVMALCKTFGTQFLQVPLHMSLFFAFRKICQSTEKVASITTGGYDPWFTDLSLIDPYLMLPVAASATLMATMELNLIQSQLIAKSTTTESNELPKSTRQILRIVPIIFLPLSMSFPSGLTLYFLCSNFCSLFSTLILFHPRIRRYFGFAPFDPAAMGKFRQKLFPDSIKVAANEEKDNPETSVNRQTPAQDAQQLMTSFIEPNEKWQSPAEALPLTAKNVQESPTCPTSSSSLSTLSSSMPRMRKQ